MEIFALLTASEYGVAALSSVTLAIGMLISSITFLAIKSGQQTQSNK